MISFYTLISFDYKYSYASIKSYYDIADEIILAIDKDRLTWNKNSFEFDKDEFLKRINEIDVNKKVRLVEENFHQHDDPMINCLEERNYVSKLCTHEYVMAIDSDEVILNIKDFSQWINTVKPDQDITATNYTVFKSFETKLLITEPIETITVGTKAKGEYKRFRSTDRGKIFSPLRILNYSWGRSHDEVMFKIKNWYYKIDFDSFIDVWRRVSFKNYENFKYFHPMKINSLWRELKVVDITKFGISTNVLSDMTYRAEKASLIIPVKNQSKIVLKCLDSIERHYSKFDVCIVDDGSDEPQCIKIMKDYVSQNPNWSYIRHDKSLGHTKACEAGIEKTFCENMFLLNSDTILTKNSINILSKVLNDNRDIAVVGSTTSSATGVQFNNEAYLSRFVWNVEQIEEFALKIEKSKGIQDIELVNGFCLGIKRSVFNAVCGFDKNLNCYGNEKELLIRVRKLDYRTVWVEGCYIHHFGKMSYSQEKSVNIIQCQVDADRYIARKHHR